jgi:hypothetical protein
MTIKITKQQAYTYGPIAAAVILLASLGLAYYTGFRDPVTVSFKRLYPAAFIDGRLISINDIEQAGITGEKLGISRADAEKKFLDSERTYAVARRMKLSITSDLAADEMRFYTKGNEQEYNTLVKNVFGSEHFFRKYVVNPQVVDAQLRMKYHSDIKTGNAAFEKAQAVVARLAKGEKFEDLARAESADRATGQIGGDLGLYESGQILPELEDMISISALGEYRRDIIITRLGYHIIYPVEYSTIEGKKMWHAKHMLFVPEGYEDWLAKQINTVEVKRIGKR